MVAWIVNDLSLAGQYAAPQDFINEFTRLFTIRPRLNEAGHSLSCARDLKYRPVSGDTQFLGAVHTVLSRDVRNMALGWLTKGPFWTAPPEGNGVVYRYGVDVTDQGLGVATRRRWLGEDARTFSFQGLPQFAQPSLDVECLRDGASIDEIAKVPNDWEILAVEQAEPAFKQPTGWAGMLKDAKSFTGLDIAYEQISDEIAQYPYDRGARDRILEIMKYLNELSLARSEHGDGSQQVTDWMRKYVFHNRAAFSSEDDKDGAFWFYDPFLNKKIHCPWHGKVHNPLQYRVHYEWPVPHGQVRLKVLFIGEKLTKQ